MSHGPAPSDIFAMVGRVSRTPAVTLHSKGGGGMLSAVLNSSGTTGGPLLDNVSPGGFTSGGGTGAGATGSSVRFGGSAARDNGAGVGSGAGSGTAASLNGGSAVMSSRDRTAASGSVSAIAAAVTTMTAHGVAANLFSD